MATVKIVKHLSDKGYPTHDKRYPYAHEKANQAEKKDSPKKYRLEKKSEKKLSKHELMATHDKLGNIKIEKKFKKFKPTLIIHERIEHKIDPGKKRK